MLVIILSIHRNLAAALLNISSFSYILLGEYTYRSRGYIFKFVYVFAGQPQKTLKLITNENKITVCAFGTGATAVFTECKLRAT